MVGLGCWRARGKQLPEIFFGRGGLGVGEALVTCFVAFEGDILRLGLTLIGQKFCGVFCSKTHVCYCVVWSSFEGGLSCG